MNTSLTEEQWQTYLSLKAKADDYLSMCLRLEAVKRFDTPSDASFGDGDKSISQQLTLDLRPSEGVPHFSPQITPGGRVMMTAYQLDKYYILRSVLINIIEIVATKWTDNKIERAQLIDTFYTELKL